MNVPSGQQQSRLVHTQTNEMVAPTRNGIKADIGKKQYLFCYMQEGKINCHEDRATITPSYNYLAAINHYGRMNTLINIILYKDGMDLWLGYI